MGCCRRSKPAGCEEVILTGLSAQRIYPDLVEQNGFSDSYESVKRFVRQAASQEA